MAQFHSFSWLRSVPLSICTTSSLSSSLFLCWWTFRLLPLLPFYKCFSKVLFPPSLHTVPTKRDNWGIFLKIKSLSKKKNPNQAATEQSGAGERGVLRGGGERQGGCWLAIASSPLGCWWITCPEILIPNLGLGQGPPHLLILQPSMSLCFWASSEGAPWTGAMMHSFLTLHQTMGLLRSARSSWAKLQSRLGSPVGLEIPFYRKKLLWQDLVRSCQLPPHPSGRGKLMGRRKGIGLCGLATSVFVSAWCSGPETRLSWLLQSWANSS